MDQVIARMSSDRIMVAYHRTIRELGTDAPDCSCPIFLAEFQAQLENMACQQILNDLREANVVTVDVGSDGEYRYDLAVVTAVAAA